MKEIVEEILKIIRERWGWRPTLEILSVLLGASATTFLVSHKATYQQLLAVGIWVCAAFWYVCLCYWKRLGRLPAITVLMLALVVSAAWALGMVHYVAAQQREVSRLVALAKQFEVKGLYADAVQKQMEAVSLIGKNPKRKDELEPTCRLARYEFEAGQLDAADATLHSCLSLAVEFNDHWMEGVARGGLGQLAVARGHFDLARQYYLDAISTLQGEHAITDKADAQLALGELEERQGNPKAAFQLYSTVRSLYRQRGDTQGEASALVHISELERFTGETDAARRDIVDASELYRKLGDLVGRGNALFQLAELESYLGNFSAALQAYGEARGLYQQVPNHSGEGNALRGMGDVEASRNNTDLARNHYLEAQHNFEQVSDALGTGGVYVGLGRLELAGKSYAPAHDYFSKARVIFQQLNDTQNEAVADFYDSHALLGLDQRDSAVKMMAQAAAAYSSVGMKAQAEQAIQLQQKISSGGLKP